MLAYSVERYLPTKAHIITLECAGGGYLYAGIKAYNSGILLTHDPDLNSADKLMEAAKPKNIFRRKSIDGLYENLPNPLKPLAFLLYQTKEDYKIFSEQIGALHIILQTIHPTYWFKTPKEQRIDLSFGASLKAEYEYDWAVFFAGCIKYDDLIHPKENTERHPIFVINASAADMTHVFGDTAYHSPPNAESVYKPKNVTFDERGNAVIEIDLDSLPDVKDTEDDSDNGSDSHSTVTGSTDEPANGQESEKASDDPVSEAYRKLLGVDSEG